MSRVVADTLLKQLKNPFDPKFVKWRVGATNKEKTKGIALAYIDSREVMKRLDEVCGVENWRDRYVPVNEGFICEIDIKIGEEWITRSNAAGYTKVEPIKGGASDAFKRAASTWGVGRYLYYMPSVWVDIKAAGNSYVLAEIPELPDWAIPGEVEKWEDVAELELEANATADEVQELAGEIVASITTIRDAKTIEELNKITDSLDTEQMALMSKEISKKTNELLNAGN